MTNTTSIWGHLLYGCGQIHALIFQPQLQQRHNMQLEKTIVIKEKVNLYFNLLNTRTFNYRGDIIHELTDVFEFNNDSVLELY